ncbi:sensor domain-containing diguanylate cyclase [Psychromonas sp. PT13]|uniref:sensor domain-containing diguanylate cyclase n=1 Tax=Psychromonas sp. PT13 TaxID=3439547 RepID=UPI003EBB4742
MSFKQRMLMAISSLIILGFLISAIFSFKISQQQALNSLINHEMPLTLDNVYSDIQRDLLMPQLVSSLMANDTFLHSWVESESNDVDEITQYLNHIKEEYGLFTAFFVSETSKQYFYAGGLLKKISGNNPVDDWYFNFRDTDAESELNIDPDMSNANQLAIFINVKVRDKNNNIMGVTGVGLNINNVKNQFDLYYEKYGKSVFLINKYGDILLFGNEHAETNNIHRKVGIEDFADNILTHKEGTFAYQNDGKSYLLITRYVEELDLVLCVEAETGNINPAVFKPLIINIVISLILLSVVLLLIFKTISRYQERLEKVAWNDHLTGLSNRASFTIQYQKEASRCTRLGREMAVLMLDIDFFKEVNDTIGHVQGDKVLARCAEILQNSLRLPDIIARWGGEEFVILLPDITLQEAYKLAERLRIKIANDDVLHQITNRGITISAGLSRFDVKQDMDWHISEADKQLYRAKHNGRNCVVY